MCVVTIDIKGSRKLDETQRRLLQNAIFQAMNKIKEVYPVSAIGMTAGDEFQVVIRQPEVSIDIFRLISEELPATCYFGVGFGEISDFETSVPSEMYGEAFYRSRNAIVDAKKNKRGGRVVFKLGDQLLDSEMNTLFELIFVIKSKRTKRQNEIIRYLSSTNLQKEIAMKYDVTVQAISKIIKSSGYEAVFRAEELAKQLLRIRLN